MALKEILATDDNKEVHDEEILNVLRTTDDLVVGTSDIASAVEMSETGARGRLRDLEEEGRVVSQEIGTEEKHVLVWGLSPDERRQPVNPEIDRLSRWLDTVFSMAWFVMVGSAVILTVGIVLWVVSISAGLVGVFSSDLYTPVHAFGFSFAVAGLGGLISGFVIRKLCIVVENLFERAI